MKIGERIKKRRIQLGMSQEELANKMGYKSRSTINKIELGINDIPQSKIEQFAEVMDTSIEYLMGWEEKNSPSENELSEAKTKLIEIIKELPDEKVEAVLALLGK